MKAPAVRGWKVSRCYGAGGGAPTGRGRALRLPRHTFKGRFQLVSSATADPVQMDQQASRILALGALRLDAGSSANLIKHA
jgi:hypothetical protein